MPYLLGFTIPLSILLGVLLSLGRLVADNEIIAINVAGISLAHILKVFLIIGFIFSLFLIILNNNILPNFHYQYRSQVKNLYSKNISAVIEPGVFLEHFGTHILYVGDVEGNKLKSIFIYEINEERLNAVTFAKQGEFVVDNGTLKMKLEEGFRDEVNPKNRKELYRLNFKIFFTDLAMQEKKSVTVDKKASDMTIIELKEKINHLKQLNSFPKELSQEIHKRISLSFSPITFIIVGFGIATIVRHREKSINFGIALLCAGMYYLFLILGETFIEVEILSPIIGMWMPNMIFVLLGAYLIKRNVYFR
jgi:lipopolysaccharide export LptBFGC system permease protein LptF